MKDEEKEKRKREGEEGDAEGSLSSGIGKQNTT